MPVKRTSILHFLSGNSRRLFFPVACLFLIMATCPKAHAHKVYIFAWIEGDTVHTESYFSAKKKVKGGLIQVYDISDNKLLEGRTNKHGEFSFTFPKRNYLRIVVEAGMGHQNEYLLKTNASSELFERENEKNNNQEGRSSSRQTVMVDAAQIKTIVEKALDSRLKSIFRELAAIRKEKAPGPTEIIGGIGYIFGLMGLILYLHGRKKR